MANQLLNSGANRNKLKTRSKSQKGNNKPLHIMDSVSKKQVHSDPSRLIHHRGENMITGGPEILHYLRSQKRNWSTGGRWEVKSAQQWGQWIVSLKTGGRVSFICDSFHDIKTPVEQNPIQNNVVFKLLKLGVKSLAEILILGNVTFIRAWFIRLWSHLELGCRENRPRWLI